MGSHRVGHDGSDLAVAVAAALKYKILELYHCSKIPPNVRFTFDLINLFLEKKKKRNNILNVSHVFKSISLFFFFF